jgi:large subunit ribosomal protein L29
MAKKKREDKIDYRELSSEELTQRLQESREKLFQLRFQSATAPLKNPHEISATRKDIARLLTVMNHKGKK